MRKTIAAVLALVLAAGAGTGAYYRFIYRQQRNTAEGRTSSNSEDAVFVDSVAMLSSLDTGSGVVSRYEGVVEPKETWSAKADSDRTIAKTYVKEGDPVKTGDILFSYDVSESEEKLEQNRIEIERNDNKIAMTKVELETARKEEAKAPQEERLELGAQIRDLELQIKSDEADSLETKHENEKLEEKIRSADVKSELDGIVKSVNEQNGSDMFGASSEDYITVISADTFRIQASVNEQHFGQIHTGAHMLAFSRAGDRYWKGTVSEIVTERGDSSQQSSYSDESGGSDTTSTAYPFYVALDDADGLMLGQHLYLEPDMGQTEEKDGLWLPAYYFVINETGQAHVWAASPKNTLELRRVKLGEYDDRLQQYEVAAGLNTDDYITVPVSGLQEGLPVSYIDYSGEDAEEEWGNSPDETEDAAWS